MVPSCLSVLTEYMFDLRMQIPTLHFVELKHDGTTATRTNKQNHLLCHVERACYYLNLGLYDNSVL